MANEPPHIIAVSIPQYMPETLAQVQYFLGFGTATGCTGSSNRQAKVIYWLNLPVCSPVVFSLRIIHPRNKPYCSTRTHQIRFWRKEDRGEKREEDSEIQGARGQDEWSPPSYFVFVFFIGVLCCVWSLVRAYLPLGQHAVQSITLVKFGDIINATRGVIQCPSHIILWNGVRVFTSTYKIDGRTSHTVYYPCVYEVFLVVIYTW